ncbi:germination protein, Ger(X)C family [Desulfosporosinus orientis DSM 765]|uniref:Germination protein, Ger(X)C family n=1 Tax=Desulfosporosinus orientis (strain ATCC 19365 / DSM 765 / NCIMB 8382 / VKM B-1628 / Singapore I) TaxID=768706 RepID=G7W7B8_DESOD|nr:Ger(x)C family spore germination protein [Desulfosporosinus orientis]AET65789.1 germination protein, Ger(X)C family [Desulfosporosinus orientis DSM 765]
MEKDTGKKVKIALMLSLIISLLFFTGCWGKREVEDLAPLLGVGFDLGEKPGTFLITNQYAQPKKEKGGVQINDRTLSVEASSARQAFEKMSKILNQTPFMGSLKVIVIGEDAAKAGGFNDILDFDQRFAEFRRSMYLVLAKGKAQDLLNLKLGSEVLPALYIKDLIEGGDELSAFPTVRLGHYLTILGTKSTAPILPVVESVKPGEGAEYEAKEKGKAEEIRIQGAGVLKEDRLVDFLTDEETKGYMWLENDVVNRSIDTMSLAEDSVKFGGQVLKSKTKYKVEMNSGKAELHYQIKTSIAIDEVLGLTKQLSGPEWIELVKEAEKSFAKVIKKECETSIKKERELGLDYLGIGRHIEQKNPRYWKTIKDQWNAEIADFPVSIEVETIVHHSGMSSSSAINS